MTNEDLFGKHMQIYKSKTGIELSDEVAFSQAMSLIAMVNAVYKPILKYEGRYYSSKDQKGTK